MSSTTKKALAVLALVLLCFIPTLFVMAIISDRQVRSDEVKQRIGEEWGAPQEFLGPVLLVPYKKGELVDGKRIESERTLYVFPETEDLSVALTPEEKTRGIFRIPVYGAEVKGSATFAMPDSEILAGYGYGFEWSKATIAFPLSDVRSIDPESVVALDGTPSPLLQGSGIIAEDAKGTVGQGVHVKVGMAGKTTLSSTFTLRVSGNERFSFIPAGSVTTAKVSSPWPTPSFTGAYLPTESQVSEQGFDASWRVSGLGRAFPQVSSSETFSLAQLSVSLVTTSLFDGVDQYTLVTRAVKYAILFIALTFMGFFFVEVLNRLRVHPIQYVLIGAALALFYLLLLSLSEQIAFGVAYLISAGLTSILIASYAYYVLHAKKYAYVVGGLLASLYAYLYLVLRSEDYALLSGTLLLFGILAVTMYVTRKVDWYSLDTKV